MHSWMGVLFAVVGVMTPCAFILGVVMGRNQAHASEYHRGRVDGARAAREWHRLCREVERKRPNSFPFNPPV
jgi:hypothetical protein